MIKKYSLRKIGITTLLLILSFILYNYPENINENINNTNTINIYKDNTNYLSMVKINCNSNKIEDKIETIVDYLKQDNLIPNNTTLLSYEIINDLLILNFDDNILKVNEEKEIKMIESLVYSLTSLDTINKIQIKINNEQLTQLPHSKEKISNYLDKSFGINKIYDITNIQNINNITVYYYDSNSNYVPVNYYYNEHEDKVTMIIKMMESNSFLSLNLSNYLNKEVELMNYELLEDKITLDFNDFFTKYITDGKVIEEVKYAIGYSIYDTLNIKKVEFQINSRPIDELILAN